MSMVINVDSSWTSADLADGIYQFSCLLTPLTGNAISVFILALRNGRSQTSAAIDISQNFSSYWELDITESYLKPKSIGSATRTLSIHKIGEV